MNCLMHPLKETMPLAGAKTKTKRGTGYRHGDYVVNDEFNNSVYTTQTAFLPSTTATMETLTFLAR